MSWVLWWLANIGLPFLVFWIGGAVAVAVRRQVERDVLAAKLAASVGVLMMLWGLANGSRYYLHLWGYAYDLSAVAIFVAAVWKGDWRAQVISGLLLFYTFLGEFCPNASCLGVTGLAFAVWRNVAMDSLALAVCVAIAVRARRYWVLWAGSFVLLWLATDVMTLAARGLGRWSFAWASFIWWLGVVGSILWGIWQHWREGDRRAPA